MERSRSLAGSMARAVLRTVAVLGLTVGATGSIAIREASMASYISAPHAGTSVIFRGGLFAFAGGVIPRGDVAFLDEDGNALRSADVELVANPATGRPSVRWAGNAYDVLIQKSLTCPLARFVQRGTVIAFTIAVVADDRAYLESQGLVAVSEGVYVATDLRSQVDLLQAIDVSEGVEEISDQSMHANILSSMNRVVRDSAGQLAVVGALSNAGDGTYVNADFNVKYQGYLTKRGDRRFVDFAGLPLRYYWKLGADGKTPSFIEVETFRFPRDNDRAQTLFVTFFQNAALMRRFKIQNPASFNTFVSTVCVSK